MRLALAALVALPACTGRPDGVPALGNGSHALLQPEPVATRADGLRRPRDLAFNPERPGELWVVNSQSDTATVIFDVDAEAPETETFLDPYAEHFMDGVSAIDFGAPGTFGTAQDSRNTYNGKARPDFFMGPTLWSSDFDIFARSNPEAVAAVGFDLGSHLDMLHESPESIGIAWEKDNVYWVFDGYNGAIGRYDFVADHGVGYDDHSDGIIHKFLQGEVARKKGVPSHVVFDHASQVLYIADTGNNRVLALDTTSGEPDDHLPTWEPGTQHLSWKGEDWWVVVDGPSAGLEAPSGIELVDDVLLVTDHETSEIVAFDLGGREVDRASTGLVSGSLAGIVARGLDELWFVDMEGNGVLRVR